MKPLLQVRAIDKSYAGVQALRDAHLELFAGEVHALVGENGAGKSTLIKIITGAVEPDGGEIWLNGQRVAEISPRRAKELGIAAIYQQPALFPELSVAENIALGLESGGLLARVNWRARRQQAAALLARVGARILPDREAGALTMAEQQLVEIARAIGARSRILIMDEPTAALSEEETRHLFRVIGELRDAGVAVIYISHRLEELSAIADRVTVLRDGRTIGTYRMEELDRQQLIRLMVGRELSAVFPWRARKLGEPVLELCDFGSSTAGIENINLTVHAGEIVGLAGLVGAGRTELARAIFGLVPADRGELRLRGVPVRIGDPTQAIACGIAYLPEDRQRHGVIPEMAISANITLASLDALASPWGMDFRRERAIAAHYVQRLGIKTPSIYAPVQTLSGGNQQKVALGRWLATEPQVIILDEPTQGVDVGTKAEIHRLMIELAAQGAAILMISSEMPELLGMSDRIAVMRAGTIVAQLAREEATQERVLALALGQ